MIRAQAPSTRTREAVARHAVFLYMCSERVSEIIGLEKSTGSPVSVSVSLCLNVHNRIEVDLYGTTRARDGIALLEMRPLSFLSARSVFFVHEEVASRPPGVRGFDNGPPYPYLTSASCKNGENSFSAVAPRRKREHALSDSRIRSTLMSVPHPGYPC